MKVRDYGKMGVFCQHMKNGRKDLEALLLAGQEEKL